MKVNQSLSLDESIKQNQKDVKNCSYLNGNKDLSERKKRVYLTNMLKRETSSISTLVENYIKGIIN